jgi:hypothetical protein
MMGYQMAYANVVYTNCKQLISSRENVNSLTSFFVSTFKGHVPVVHLHPLYVASRNTGSVVSCYENCTYDENCFMGFHEMMS